MPVSLPLAFSPSLVLITTALVMPMAIAAAEWPDITSIMPDLEVPSMVDAAPAAGRRVRAVTTGWEGTETHHALYLPPDWTIDRPQPWPVLVELPGNGGYRNRYGDTCDGSVAGCRLGFGATGGRGVIWVSAPLVEVTPSGTKRNAVTWWGSVEETKRYLTATVREVCQRYHGNPRRVVLAGFSRGSIGCAYIGLHDEAIASLWCGLLCHSHFDGVIEKWPYPGADRASALTRLRRLGDRPLWISHEGGIGSIRTYLDSTNLPLRSTLIALPYRNHTDSWTLRDIPERRQLRQWLAAALQ